MSLEDTVNSEIKKAMLAKDQKKLAAIRAIKSEILLLKTGKGKDRGKNQRKSTVVRTEPTSRRKNCHKLL